MQGTPDKFRDFSGRGLVIGDLMRGAVQADIIGEGEKAGDRHGAGDQPAVRSHSIAMSRVRQYFRMASTKIRWLLRIAKVNFLFPARVAELIARLARISAS
jgi:hypothetical protein